MAITSITEELRNINLSDADAADKVRACYDKINAINLPIINIPEGRRIYRATNVNEGEVISSTRRLSYKPSKMNKFYQRASIPNGTAFYGTYDPYQDKYPLINQCGAVSSVLEVCPLIRQEFAPNKTREVVVSEWLIKKDASFFALAATDGTNRSSLLNKIGFDFVPYLYQIGLNDNDISVLNDFQNFLTERYNRRVGENEEYEYLISALFAEKIKKEYQVKKGIDGLIWHSNLAVDPKLDDTLAFAMFPESTDSKLALLRCLKLDVSTDDKNCIVIANRREITDLITD